MFEGYKAKSGITKDKILSNLRQEVGAYRTWAKDAQTLIRRGADPSVVQALPVLCIAVWPVFRPVLLSAGHRCAPSGSASAMVAPSDQA